MTKPGDGAAKPDDQRAERNDVAGKVAGPAETPRSNEGSEAGGQGVGGALDVEHVHDRAS